MHNILIVDDEPSIREAFSLILKGKYNLFLAPSGEAALKIVADQKIDLIYLDIRMPGLDGIETLKQIKKIDPSMEVVMVTAVNDVQKASQAIKQGARDYVIKPFDVNHIYKLTEQLILKKTILLSGLSAQKALQTPEELLIGQSQKINEIKNILKTLKQNEKVLILGEAGTEKENLALFIHTISPRRNLSFKTIYLSEIRPTFGKNEIETDGGTIFIDNIECLPEEIILSGNNLIPPDVRLIGGGSPDLFSKRPHIFKFFSEVLLELPPLRERVTDLPILIEYYLDKYSELYGKTLSFSPLLLEAFTNYSWPGNIHELENLIRNIAAHAECKEIDIQNIPFDILLKGPEGTGSSFFAFFEKKFAAGRSRTGTVYSTEGF